MPTFGRSGHRWLIVSQAAVIWSAHFRVGGGTPPPETPRQWQSALAEQTAKLGVVPQRVEIGIDLKVGEVVIAEQNRPRQ